MEDWLILGLKAETSQNELRASFRAEKYRIELVN